MIPNINAISSSRYSYINSKGISSNLRHTESSQSNGLWREDLHHSLEDTHRDVRQQALPVILGLDPYPPHHDLFANEMGLASLSAMGSGSELAPDQPRQRHAQNQQLLQAYTEQVSPDSGDTLLSILA